MENRIKELRLQNGMTQRDLADRLHTQQNSVSYYETGKRLPSLDIVKRVADIFETPVDYVLGATNNSKRLSLSEQTLLENFRKLGAGDAHELILRAKELADAGSGDDNTN